MREKFVQKLKKLAAKGLPLIIAGSIAFGGATGFANKQYRELRNEHDKLLEEVDSMVEQVENLQKDNNDLREANQELGSLADKLENLQEENSGLREDNQELSNTIDEIRVYETLRRAIENTFNYYIKSTTRQISYNGDTHTTTTYSNNTDIEFYETDRNDSYKVCLNNKGVVESAGDGYYNKNEGEIESIRETDIDLYSRLSDKSIKFKQVNHNVRYEDVYFSDTFTHTNKIKEDVYKFDIVSGERVIGSISVKIVNNKVESIYYDYTNSYKITKTFESISKQEFLKQKENVQKFIDEQKLETSMSIN